MLERTDQVLTIRCRYTQRNVYRKSNCNLPSLCLAILFLTLLVVSSPGIANIITIMVVFCGIFIAIAIIYMYHSPGCWQIITTINKGQGTIDALTRGKERSTLPASMGRLVALERLNLNGNKLHALPETIGDLTSLQSLDLGNNQLITLPVAIERLNGLNKLNIERNFLAPLPKNIKRWIDLLKKQGCKVLARQ